MGPQLILPVDIGSVTLTSTANASLWVVPAPIRVLQVGFVVTTALTGSTATLTFNITEADGTVTSPTGAGALGALTSTSATQAVNTGCYLDVEAVNGRRIVYPGEAIEADVTDASTAGVVRAFALVEVLGYNNVDMRSSVTSHPGSTTLATALANMTKVIA